MLHIANRSVRLQLFNFSLSGSAATMAAEMVAIAEYPRTEDRSAGLERVIVSFRRR